VGTGALSSEVKQQGCEADHLAASNAGVKNEWSYTSFHLFMIYGICRYNYNFLLFSDIFKNVMSIKYKDKVASVLN